MKRTAIAGRKINIDTVFGILAYVHPAVSSIQREYVYRAFATIYK